MALTQVALPVHPLHQAHQPFDLRTSPRLLACWRVAKARVPVTVVTGTHVRPSSSAAARKPIGKCDRGCMAGVVLDHTKYRRATSMACSAIHSQHLSFLSLLLCGFCANWYRKMQQRVTGSSSSSSPAVVTFQVRDSDELDGLKAPSQVSNGDFQLMLSDGDNIRGKTAAPLCASDDRGVLISACVSSDDASLAR